MKPLASSRGVPAFGIRVSLFVVVAACGGTYENGPPPGGASTPSAAIASGASSASSASSASPPDTAPATSGTSPTERPATDKPKSIVARHILIQWMGTKRADAKVVRTREQALAVAEEVLKRAKAGESFARLVIDFSDEPNAGQRGGSLGRFHRGDMDKEFEAAAFALAPGEISGVVETPFGFHIIQRTE